MGGRGFQGFGFEGFKKSPEASAFSELVPGIESKTLSPKP